MITVVRVVLVIYAYGKTQMRCLKDLGAYRVPMVVGDFAGGSIGTILSL